MHSWQRGLVNQSSSDIVGINPRGAARRAQMLRFYSKRRGTIQYVYSIICYRKNELIQRTVLQYSSTRQRTRVRYCTVRVLYE